MPLMIEHSTNAINWAPAVNAVCGGRHIRAGCVAHLVRQAGQVCRANGLHEQPADQDENIAAKDQQRDIFSRVANPL
jgi:hypothetical protein